LSEEEKQTISTLSTLAAGLAGGIAGDSTGSAITGAQTGKNAVENNFLTAKDVHELKEELLEAEKTGANKQTIYDKFKERSEKNRQEGVADNCSHNPGCVVSVWEMMNSGTDVASGLNRTSFFSSLSSEEMAQLNRFVQAENAESAQAIYQSLPDVVKKVVEGKEFAEQFGVMPKVGGSSGIIGLGIAGKKPATKDTGNTGTKGTNAAHNQQVNKSNLATAEKDIVLIEQGKKGGWSKVLNKPEPNKIYHVRHASGEKIYHTDGLSRPVHIETSLHLSKNDRNTYQQCKAGKCGNPGDEGGHLIASIFGGPGERLNVVPMDGNLNKGAWKQMENSWAKELKAGKRVDVKIQPRYSDNSNRPSSFDVSYTVDNGRPIEINIKNVPGGKK
ncbi:DNA/RNA non-specific endonuclease, partial [Photorhabdus sp. RW14-46]|uniref:DNA/RNA non-specific endonuclease n=1 Tax=Photorhabdus sp. RW14-46 TaxID=2100168 RepID=UPI001F620B25